MSVSTSTLQLILEAQNLAGSALGQLTSGLDGVATKASSVAGKVTESFGKLGGGLANALGNSVENLAQGGSLGPTLLAAGAYMAGQVAEEFGGQMIEKLGSSTLVGALTAPLAALGTAAGGILDAAIGIGMAALPFVLVAALVAAVAVLIVNEDIRNQVVGFGTGLVGTLLGAIGPALGALVGVVVTGFGLAWSAVLNGVVPFVGSVVALILGIPAQLAGLGGQLVSTIIGGLSELPLKVANVIRDAFLSLSIDVGPFHIHGGGITLDLPHVDLPHFAAGVEGFGGGLAVVGERGPEVVRLPRGSDVIPSGAGGSASSGDGGVRIVGISREDLADMIDREFYFRLQLAPPSSGRP